MARLTDCFTVLNCIMNGRFEKVKNPLSMMYKASKLGKESFSNALLNCSQSELLAPVDMQLIYLDTLSLKSSAVICLAQKTAHIVTRTVNR